MYRAKVLAVAGMALACALIGARAEGESQARIVRLSDVKGTVQINKNAGLGFENAFANLPVTQGTEVRTGDNGRAEVEFEDGSTLRMTPKTTVRFSELGLSDAGKRMSEIEVVDGEAYIHWLGKGGDELALHFSQEKVELKQAAHFRVVNSAEMAELANFKNELEVTGPAGATKVGKKKMVSFAVNENDAPSVAKNVEDDPFDEWDKRATEYHDQYSRNNSTPYGYGFSDLNYYGGFSNISGYGMLWQPYFASAGWNPFMDGAWSWYPGFGFMWASAYPWGWMPYYYGNWVYAPGFGWGWQAGGWNNWHGGVHYIGAALAGFRTPVAPVGTVSTVVVGRGGAQPTRVSGEGLVVTRGSAGLGVARGSVGNLHALNRQVERTGSAQVHSTAAFAASSHSSGWGFGGGGHAMSGGGHASGGSSGHSSGGGGHSGH